MTTYYVGSGGNDGLAGTSYANRWLTIGKALGAAGIASGDTVYLTPGTYREVVSVAMTSATVETKVIGDVDGSHTSGTPGDVVWTAYTTNDTTAPSGTALLTFAGRDFLTFQNLLLVGGTVAPLLASTTTSTNITFTDCTVLNLANSSNILTATVGFAVNAAWLFNRCRLISRGTVTTLTLTRGTGSDYDSGFTYRNCLFAAGSTGFNYTATGAGVNFGGGGLIENCTIFASNGVSTAVANLSTTVPIVIQNSVIQVFNVALNANTSGQITENHNLISASTARTNVSAGSGSIADGSYSSMIEVGHEAVTGRRLTPFFTPMAGSPLLGFGAASSPPTVDALNRPRPAGGQTTNAVGYLERHDTATKQTGTTDAGGVAITITGPGDHDFQIPVDAVSTTITVKVNYDTNHGTSTPPRAQLLANAEIGYAGETVTASASTGTWLTLTFAAFTPSAKSIVTLRLISRAAAASGVAHFDTVTVT